ncbi:MAG TPA: virulence factor MviM [Mesotoga infera]|uniref:Virulence factor MviM n=1 Tax=Mesotoga infera TaxID=1236046 RepID=A0A7C1CS83_9BACT|nr:virulence factor MviM [Mesotoga infera]
MKKGIQTVAAGSLYITVFTLLSKGLGFFREVLTADLFGTSWRLDAVVIALSPARVITSIISAGLIAVFVPQYIKIRKRDPEDSRRFVWSVLVTFGLIYAVFGGFLMLFPSFFVKVFAPGFSTEILDYASDTLKLLAVFPFISGLQQLLSGLLKAERRFLQYSIAQLIFNIFAIPLIFFLSPYLNEMSIAYGWIVGNALVTVIMFLFSSKFISASTRIFSEDLRFILYLAIPLVISSGLGQVSTIVDKAFLSLLPPGQISGLHYADTLLGIVSSVFIISFLETTRTELSEFVANDDVRNVQLRMRKTAKTSLSIAIPIVFWIAFMGEPLVRLIFEHGEFTSESTTVVAIAIIGYTARIIFQPLGFLARQFFISHGRVRFMVYLTFFGIALNFFFDWILLEPFGIGGITASTSLVTLISTAIWVYLVERKGVSFVPWKTIVMLLGLSTAIVLISLAIRSNASETLFLIAGNCFFFALTLWATRDIMKYILRRLIPKIFS